MNKLFTCLLFLLGFFSTQVLAQRENDNWYFGNNAGLSFASTPPVPLLNGAMVTYEATASVSDAAGKLLFYTNSVDVWNRNHQPMANGQVIGGHESAAQGAVIVKNPANANQYYIFVVDGCDNRLQGGLKYSVVDMTQNGGLGAVTQRAVQLSAISVTERVTAVPHANGRDFWIITHGWGSNTFYCYQLSGLGISTIPVATSVGQVHSGGGGAFGNANAVGYMKASPNSAKLAVAKRDSNVELFDFNNATGQLANGVMLPQFYRSYGVAFSADNSRLYTTTLDGNSIYQFNVLAGSASAIANSAVLVGTTPFGAYAGALQLGPDEKIYVAQFGSSSLGRIDNPNTLGVACGFRSSSISLGGRLSQLGLPNFPSTPLIVAPTVTFAASAVCLGTASSFVASVNPLQPSTTLAWTFGEPASGAANSGTGTTPTHTYAQAGTYNVTLSVTAAGLPNPIVTTLPVVVNALPTVSLGLPVQQVCQGSSVLLNAGPQLAGTTYRWQDGSTNATLVAFVTGVYTVDVTSAAGCSSRASTSVQVLPAPVIELGPEPRQLCDGQTTLLSVGAQPAGSTYRWQDGSTASTFEAVAAGTYSVVVTTPAGCSSKKEIVVNDAGCPFMIPNIITPNGDKTNEFFVLKGLAPQAWKLEIYNRWGTRVYQTASYNNDWNAAGQSAGVYYYLLRHTTDGRQFRGWLEVVR
ncbi:T9SS type B sorting domain-containing protein [Hymenobacter aquaticus]|nr:gliding motility-associated C-terminal domain-containing protein [Hymenobacter aquaticus]